MVVGRFEGVERAEVVDLKGRMVKYTQVRRVAASAAAAAAAWI